MIKSVDQLSVSGRRVFLRVDFNVPRENGKITDDTRIREALPTILHLREQKAKIILASHLGRPDGKNPEDSLLEVASRLTELIDHEVIFPEDCIGDGVRKLAHDLREGDLMLLENLRFHQEEVGNDPTFSKSLAGLAEIYVNDAFGSLHRAHASVFGMVPHFKEKGIGLLVKREIEFLALLNRPKRPFFAVLGGAKVGDKIGLVESLLSKVDGLIIGGGLAYTFLKAKGEQIGQSRLEVDKVLLAQRILQKAEGRGVPITLPKDHRVAKRIAADEPSHLTDRIGAEEIGVDIGPETAREFSGLLSQAKTIFWNGPMGVFEMPSFALGTTAVAKAVAAATDGGAVSVVGGGETLAAVRSAGVAEGITHLSTGGGATLEYLEGKELPGLKVLG